MLSDEEKKAIEILKDREYDFDELYCTFRQSFIKPYDKSIGIILELIKKQQKEIEELKNADLTIVYLNGVYDGVKKVEDKIKAKTTEIINRPVKDEFITATQGKLNTIIDIESLLNEEE